ncbi:MAG TPA: hypothetical protein VM532_01395, partial [Burkholderiales bacterium]|nr:hypothetical protein [Burkholderiales bacterium]
ETGREEIEIVSEVAKLKKLQALDAQDTSLGNEGFKKLLPLATTLRAVNLRNTHVTDEIAETLKQFKALRELDLRSTKVSDETKRAIAVALPNLIYLDGAPYRAKLQTQQQSQSNSGPVSSLGMASTRESSKNGKGRGGGR